MNVFIDINIKVKKDRYSYQKTGDVELSIEIPKGLVGKIEFGNVVNAAIAAAVLDLEEKEEDKDETTSS